MRCDRCPAKAVVQFVKAGEQPWRWCFEHARVYDVGLRAQGWERWALARVPA